MDAFLKKFILPKRSVWQSKIKIKRNWKKKEKKKKFITVHFIISQKC
jgi:hypothetical protein